MDAIDRLLLDWYDWNLGWEPIAGYPRDAGLEGFQRSGQWMDLDDLNEEVDRRIIEGRARAIDPLVLALDVHLRFAVNLAAGADVLRNPRWPATQNADYLRAKDLLAPKLIMCGLILCQDR